MEEVTDVGWGKAMQGLLDHGQDLRGYAMLNGKPMELLEDRGDVVMFLGVGWLV